MSPGRLRSAVLAAALLVALVGVAVMRAAFAPKGVSAFAPIPHGAPLLSEPAAVLGYFTLVAAGILAIAGTGAAPPRRALLVAEGVLALAAAGGAAVALAAAWPALAAAAGGVLFLEGLRRRAGRAESLRPS